jgi:hypothetical protein
MLGLSTSDDVTRGYLHTLPSIGTTFVRHINAHQHRAFSIRSHGGMRHIQSVGHRMITDIRPCLQYAS